MVTALTPSQRTVVADLRAAGEALALALDQALDPLGVTAFEYAILDALLQVDPHLMRLTELGDATRGTLPRVSRAVANLERGGLVEKVACPSDGRAINAVLTAAGESLHGRGAAVYAETAGKVMFDDLGDADAAELARLLGSVMERISDTGACRTG